MSVVTHSSNEDLMTSEAISIIKKTEARWRGGGAPFAVLLRVVLEKAVFE